ncbi:MAG: lectin-like domain-containing protein [Cytophagaceae bacterium]
MKTTVIINRKSSVVFGFMLRTYFGYIRISIAGFLLLLTSRVAVAQFQVNNDASDLGGGFYQLTPYELNKAGSVWYKLQHDLRDPFTVEGRFNFGNDPAGADGIAFVMQNNCLTAGTAGGGIGYKGLPGKSFILEFDTWQNSTGGGDQNNNDPAYDHFAIMKHGVANHVSDSNLLGPLALLPANASVKTGQWYDFRISYDPVTMEVEVEFNNSILANFTYNIRNEVFDGNPYVYWGFTSSTGGFMNDQRVYINKSLSTFVLKDTTICDWDVTVTLPPLTKFIGMNLALGKPATSSSNEHGGTSANNAVDGNMTTRWSSQFSDPQWISIDLGSAHDIDSVRLNWEGAYATEYRIQYSLDGVSWTNAFHETAGNGGWDVIKVPSTDIRYVRMYGLQRATGYGYSLWEFQIYGMPKYIWSPNNGTISDIYSNSPTFSPTATTTYTVLIPDPCTGATPYNYTITVDCSILPVELISFNAVVVNNKAQLTWTTAKEVNSHSFVIMKSNDGITFHPVGAVPAKGISNTITNYVFSDDSFDGSLSYYYLLQKDLDGSESKSPVRTVKGAGGEMYLTSNPFDYETTLVINFETEILHVSICNVLGQEYFSRTYSNPSQIISLGAELPGGIYLINVRTEEISKVFKVKKD